MAHESPSFTPTEEATVIQQEMHERIISLPFPAFCQLIRKLLYLSGYSSIQALGTGARRKTTGRGGSDLLALAHTDLATVLTAIQIKQYRQSVPRRFIDELRGTMLRMNAEQGLMIVTSHFSSTARSVAAQSQLLPIQLIDGEQLIGLLISRRIGLKRAKIAGTESWIFDADYFNDLERRAERWLKETRTKPESHNHRQSGHTANVQGGRQ